MNKLNKKQCVNAKNRLRSLAYTTCDCKEDNIHEVMVCGAILEQIIKEYFELKEKVDSIQDLFDNKPYELEDLEVGMHCYVFVNTEVPIFNMKVDALITKICDNKKIECIFVEKNGVVVYKRIPFKENRFYPREVK